MNNNEQFIVEDKKGKSALEPINSRYLQRHDGNKSTVIIKDKRSKSSLRSRIEEA
jgi:hypothetical protein